MGRIVTSWQENGIQYTITATPVAPVAEDGNELISIFDYLGGKTPAHGTGESVYKHAIAVGAKVDSKQVATKTYTGKVMLYERAFLDTYFNPAPVAKMAQPISVDKYEDDDLPF